MSARAFMAVARRWARVHGVFPVLAAPDETDVFCRRVAEQMQLPLHVAPAPPCPVPSRPTFLLLDGLECPGMEEDVLLPLVTSGHLHGAPLPQGSVIAGALRTQQVGEEERRRLLPLSPHAVFFSLASPREHSPLAEALLPRVLSMRKVMWIARLERGIALPPEALRAVVTGGIHPWYAPAVFACLLSRREARIARTIASLRREGPALAWTLPIPTLQIALQAIVEQLPTAFFAEVTERLAGTLGPADMHETYARLYADLASRVRTHGDAAEIFAGDSVQQVAACLDRLARKLALRTGGI